MAAFPFHNQVGALRLGDHVLQNSRFPPGAVLPAETYRMLSLQMWHTHTHTHPTMSANGFTRGTAVWLVAGHMRTHDHRAELFREGTPDVVRTGALEESCWMPFRTVMGTCKSALAGFASGRGRYSSSHASSIPLAKHSQGFSSRTDYRV